MTVKTNERLGEVISSTKRDLMEGSYDQNYAYWLEAHSLIYPHSYTPFFIYTKAEGKAVSKVSV